MPTSLSTKKRIRQNRKRRLRNRAVKGVVKVHIKKALAAIDSADAEARNAEVRAAIRALDKAAARGVIHKNTAARRKARLMARLNKATAAPSANS